MLDIEILALPCVHSNLPISAKFRRLGIPIYSLPGWDDIPLYGKLPMFKSPLGDVVFSKNKVGNTLNLSAIETEEKIESRFENYPGKSITTYNPLHDLNLRDFFTRPINLKNLQKIGQITSQKDVVCSLKDFNEHRWNLYQTLVKGYPAQLERHNANLKMRTLIRNAESIDRQEESLKIRRTCVIKSSEEILRRKKKLDEAKTQHALLSTMKTKYKWQTISEQRKLQEALWEAKKAETNLRINRCIMRSNNIERSRINNIECAATRKRQQRKFKQMLDIEAARYKEHTRNVDIWSRRLEYRTLKQERKKELVEIVDKRRRENVMKHQEKHRYLWQKYSDSLQQNKVVEVRKNKIRRKKPNIIEEQNINDPDGSRTFNLINSYANIRALLDIVDDIENRRVSMKSQRDNTLYKAAEFFLNVVLRKFHDDMSTCKSYVKSLTKRIIELFEKIKYQTIQKSTRVIVSSIDEFKQEPTTLQRSNDAVVTFQKYVKRIGVASYEIEPEVHLRQTINRLPTPSGSISTIDVHDKIRLPELNMMERKAAFFVEYLFLKFKRQLTLEVQHLVINAIYKHREEEILNFRSEFRKMDRNYLASIMAKAILRYGINMYDFASNIRLCTLVLASEIVWELQKEIIKPKRDSRNISDNPQNRCCIPGSLHLFCCR